MQYLTLISTLLALTSLSQATTCTVCRDGFNINHIKVTADNVLDVPGICGGLWDNLKRFSDCSTPSATSCGGGESGVTGPLEWKFAASQYCNPGMVESTWWEATKNDFGGIECVESSTIAVNCAE